MIEEATRFLEDLNEEQKDIVLSNDNLYVTACPGSGKTRVLTRKLAYQVIKYADSLKKKIAITYTNRAANEIKNRLDILGIDSQKIWIGTIHQFCLEFIIYPYKMNLPKISKGFTIIDDFIQREYIQGILQELNMKLKDYEIKKINLSLTEDFAIVEKKHSKVAVMYHELLNKNKEIDFDMILVLAYKILSNNIIVAKNIANTIGTIFVDEFQDTRELQYKIIGEFTQANLKIQSLFVGDIDQAIYGSLNGTAKTVMEIEQITRQKFTSKTLYGCYRSSQRLVDFYSNFQITPYNIKSRGDNKGSLGIIKYDFSISKEDLPNEIKEIIKERIENNISEEEICIVAPQHYSLFSLSEQLKKLLPNCDFDAISVSPIKVNDHSAFFKLAILYFTEAGVKTKRRKMIANEILNIFINEFGVELEDEFISLDLLKIINSIKKKYTDTDGIEYYTFITDSLFNKLNITERTYPNLFNYYFLFIEEMNQRIRNNNLSQSLDSFQRMFMKNQGITITTAHKVKGEEYDTMIAINLLEGKIPHWDEIYSKSGNGEESARKLLYVICSRARNNLYLFSETGYSTKKGYPLVPTSLLIDVDYKYN